MEKDAMSWGRARSYVMLLVAVTAWLWVTMDRPQARGVRHAVLPLDSRTFVVDPNSSLSVSGTAGSSPIEAQGPGSLTTTYSGTIAADMDLDAGTISFRPETLIVATDSGDWQPRRGGVLGSEPANYGGQATISIFRIRAAVRDGAYSTFTDQPLPLTPMDDGLYSFESRQSVVVTSGVFDYNAGVGFGSTDVTGYTSQNTASPGTLQDLGDGSFGLTVPVDFTLNTNFLGTPVTIRFVGSLSGLTAPARAF